MRARATNAVVLAMGAGALAVSGCDWRDFDTLQGGTPVVAVGAPSGYQASQDFGRVLLPVASPKDGSAAARYLVSATAQTALAVVNLDVRGHASGQTLTADALAAIGLVPVTAMAEVRGARKALLGAPTPSGGDLLLVNLEPPYEVTSFFTSLEPHFGVGVAAGALGGGPADDLVALSGNALHVFVDGQTTTPNLYYTDPGTGACPILLSGALPPDFRVNRAVAIGGLLAGSGVQIAVGTPVVSGPGSVSIFNLDTTTGVASCALTLTGSESRFGQALAIGDFDGDGIGDLLVGAPPTRAYLYRGPVTATPTATITSAGSTDFGGALAALDLDGKAGAEALIADPEATVGSHTFAGHVAIFKGPALGTPVPPTPATSVLADHDPGDNEVYGSAVAALPFCAPAQAPRVDAGADAGTPDAGTGGTPDAGTACVSTTLPLVGSASKAFTYFTLGPTDPRVK